MSHWQKIRDSANVLRSEVCAATNLNENELYPAQQFLERVAEHLELEFIPEHPDSVNLSGALAVLEDDCVYFNNHLKKWYKTFCIAHEVGHHILHHQSVHCTQNEIQDFEGEADSNSATEKIVGYGAGDRREREANLFALELLLPCDVLRRTFLEENLNARQITGITQMPIEVVAGQLARALLVPNAEIKTAETGTEKYELKRESKTSSRNDEMSDARLRRTWNGKDANFDHAHQSFDRAGNRTETNLSFNLLE